MLLPVAPLPPPPRSPAILRPAVSAQKTPNACFVSLRLVGERIASVQQVKSTKGPYCTRLFTKCAPILALEWRTIGQECRGRRRKGHSCFCAEDDPKDCPPHGCPGVRNGPQSSVLYTPFGNSNYRNQEVRDPKLGSREGGGGVVGRVVMAVWLDAYYDPVSSIHTTPSCIR
jgi:hypothetical protein